MKVGDVFMSKAINDLPSGAECPFFKLQKYKGIDCRNYFSEKPMRFEIREIKDDGRITLSTSNKTTVVIPNYILQQFIDDGLWQKETNSSSITSPTSANPYSTGNENIIYYNGGKRKSKKRKSNKRKQKSRRRR